MLFEQTTLAATAQAIAEAIEALGGDPEKPFRRAGLDMNKMLEPGARYAFRAVIRLWEEVRREVAEPCIGLLVAHHLRPQALHALGLSWLSSGTLLSGMQRMVRYSRIANTSLRLRLVPEGKRSRLIADFATGDLRVPPDVMDAILATVVNLCRLIGDRDFAPLLVSLVREDNGHMDRYADMFQAPVHCSKPENALHFDTRALAEPAPAGNEILAQETDRLAERYLTSLDSHRVRDQVRRTLLSLLSSGDVDQRTVARGLNRSVSALQRQLKAEGSSYRQVLDEVRTDLAQQFVSERRYSLGQIAYLLGFSDQANFSRAFKRWTGSAPREFLAIGPAAKAARAAKSGRR